MVTINSSLSDDDRDSVVFVRNEDLDTKINSWASEASTTALDPKLNSHGSAAEDNEHTDPLSGVVQSLEPDFFAGSEVPDQNSTSPSTETLSEDESDDEEGMQRLNTEASLSKGHILSRDGKTEFNILLVGETGVGKTTLLTFIWNVLNIRMPSDYQLEAHDAANESGLGSGSSQTNDAKLYRFTSQNGVVLQVLDTPGLSDTRGRDMDEQHKVKIAQSIKDLVVSLDAVLIMANGTNPRLNVSTEYALTTLSAMFPESLIDNIGMFFTNIQDPLSANLEATSLPESLQNTAMFKFNNSVSLEVNRRKVVKSLRKAERAMFSKRVDEAHEYALGTFASLLDWVDSRSPQPTKDIIALYEYSLQIERQILNAQSQLAQALTAQEELQTLKSEISKDDVNVRLFQNFESVVNRKIFELVSSSQTSTTCHYPGCHLTCHDNCGGATGFWWWVNPGRCNDCWGSNFLFWVYPACKRCGHDHHHHRLSNNRWLAREHEDKKIDHELREKYLQATTEKDKKHYATQQIDHSLEECSDAIAESMKVMAELAESYSSQSLSGGYPSQLEQGVKLSQEVLKTMTDKGNNSVATRKIGDSLRILEEKLKVLKDAQAKKRQKIYHAENHTTTLTELAANAIRKVY